MDNLEAYDKVLHQIEQITKLMERNLEGIDDAPEGTRAERIALGKDMLKTVNSLEALAEKILELAGVTP